MIIVGHETRGEGARSPAGIATPSRRFYGRVIWPNGTGNGAGRGRSLLGLFVIYTVCRRCVRAMLLRGNQVGKSPSFRERTGLVFRGTPGFCIGQRELAASVEIAGRVILNSTDQRRPSAVGCVLPERSRVQEAHAPVEAITLCDDGTLEFQNWPRVSVSSPHCLTTFSESGVQRKHGEIQRLLLRDYASHGRAYPREHAHRGFR